MIGGAPKCSKTWLGLDLALSVATGTACLGTAPTLRLDRDRCRGQLLETAKRLRPRLLLLDPLVRLHGIDENHAGEVAELLAYIRSLQRQEAPTPYEPGTGCYLDDVDWEVASRQYEQRRPGRMDFKALALFRDGYRCRQCGIRVAPDTSEADHIKPVSSFASYAQATNLLNLQTLCLDCHKEKTYAT